MRAVVQTRTGGPGVFEVQERPDPTDGERQVKIEFCAAGVNVADTMARSGLYPDAPKPPCVLGYEVAGVVVVVPEAGVFPLLERLSFEQGAGPPLRPLSLSGTAARRRSTGRRG